LRQDACKKVFRETGEHVDIEARCPQKIGEKEAGGKGESYIDIETRMNARSC